ncbi:MAG TPA: hypothetical protein VEP30_08470 [Chthoniobacterales bacterium]|nr:hypothetical protein [Chthoniobacterales bacterium]
MADDKIRTLEIQSSKTVEIARAITSVLSTLIKYGFVFGCFFYAYLSIKAMSGKATTADINIQGSAAVKLYANRYFADALFFMFGTGGVVYGHYQRRLYRKTTGKLKRLEKYERMLDSNRSSSGLREGYETNPEDVV